MGSCGEGIYSEGGICADRNEGEVFDVEVSGEGECKGFFERIEVEKGGVGTGGGNDQRSGLSVHHHFIPSRSNFASMQMLWTLQQTQQSMDASMLMTMLLQEAECQDLRSQRHKQMMGKLKRMRRVKR